VQVYEFTDSETSLTYHWNATEGRRLAMERGARPFTVNLAEAGITLKNILDFAPELDVEKAKRMNWGALLVPILFVPHGHKHVCIDGWHRIYKALHDGLQVLPALLLTQKEAGQILLGASDATNHPG
jgi:hypothetical protein